MMRGMLEITKGAGAAITSTIPANIGMPSAADGPILSGAAAAATITKAIGVWGQIIEIHNHVWTAVQGFTGLVAGYLGGLHGLDTHPLPAGSYDHPAV
jgi:hypothetical protein